MRVIHDGGEVDIGQVEATPTISLFDYSRRETDDFGVTTVVPRRFSRRVSVRLALPTDQVDAAYRQLTALRTKPAQWIADETCAWLNFEGFFRGFEVTLSLPSLSYCTLTIEGLAETEAVANPTGDPAPNGPSTLRLIQPADIATGMLTSNIPENDHPIWAGGTSYAAGARVIKTTTHRIYESAAAGNVGHDPEAADGYWIEVGPTNRWAMFDEALGTLSSRAGSIVVTIDADAIDAVALLDVTGATVRVQTTGYNRLLPVGDGSLTFLDLPLANNPITVTITGSGTVSAGTLLLGRLLRLGTTEAAPTAGITDFSKKEADDFGEVTIVERAWAKRMSARALIRTDAIDLTANRLASVRARPALWIADADLDSLTIYGFAKDWSIERGETVSGLSLSIEGLSKAPPPPPPLNIGSPRGDYSEDETYYPGDTVVWRVADGGAGDGHQRIGEGPSIGIPPSDTSKWTAYVEGGGDGAPSTVPGPPGPAAYTPLLTNDPITLTADALGNVLSYAGAEGEFRLLRGNAYVTEDCEFSIPSGGNPQALTGPFAGSPLNPATGAYSVTGGLGASEEGATLTMRAVYLATGAEFDKILSIGKSKQGASSDDELADLQADLATALDAIAAAESTIATLVSGVAALNGDFSSLDAEVATLTSTVSTQGSSISTNATAISTVNANVASLTTTVGTLNSTVSTQASTLTTLNSNFASLSSTVSTQGTTITSYATSISTLNGNVSTLFGRAGVRVDVNGRMVGWEVNNNGTVGNFVIHSDYFILSKPGGGARLEYSDGNLRVYDISGTLRTRLGVWS